MRLSKMLYADGANFSMLFVDTVGKGFSELLFDESESVRESAVDALLACGKSLTVEAWGDVAGFVSNRVCQRFDPASLEPCEEIREKKAKLLGTIIPFLSSARFSEIVECLCRAVSDRCPEVKKSGCDAACRLPLMSTSNPDHNTLIPLIDALVSSARHQHWRVRKACIDALGKILSMGEPPLISTNVDKIIQCVSAACVDHAHQVRSASAIALVNWLDCRSSASWRSKLCYWLSGLILDTSPEVYRSALRSDIPDIDSRINTFHKQYSSVSHSKWCVESASFLIDQKLIHVGDDVAKSHFAAQVLTVFADHVSGVQAEAVLKSLSSLSTGGDSLVCEASTRLTRAIPVVDLIPILHKFISTAVKSDAKIAIGSIKILDILIRASNDLNLISEEVIRCSEIASYWPSLVSDISRTVRGFLSQSPALTDDHRWRLLQVLLRCKSNGEPDQEIGDVFDLLGPTVFDDYYEQALELVKKDPSNRELLKDLISRASLHRCIVPSLEKEMIPILRDLGRPSDDNTVDARLDSLEIITVLANRKGLSSKTSEDIIREILIPNLSWRAGQANSALRKVALVTFRTIIESDSTSITESIISSSLGVIRCCMEDSWSPDIRMLATLLLKDFLDGIESTSSTSALAEVYSDVLKRLDDSHLEIRIVGCNCMRSLFCANRRFHSELSVSSFTYIVKALLVHLDDDSEAVAEAARDALNAGRQLFVEDILGRECEAIINSGRAIHLGRFHSLSQSVA